MQLNDEQILIQEAARKFATDQLVAARRRMGSQRHIPTRCVGGYGCTGLPEHVGSRSMGRRRHWAPDYSAALEEIAAGCEAVSTIMSEHNSVGCLPILQFGTDSQKEQFLTALATGKHLSAFA